MGNSNNYDLKMYAKSALLLCLLAVFNTCNSQVIFNGACPTNINTLNNVDLKQYSGIWYEFAKYPNSFELNGICVQAEYTQINDNTMKITNTMTDPSNGSKDVFITFANTGSCSKWSILLPNSNNANQGGNYWILDTDYNNFSVVYSCKTLQHNKHAIYSWILTRQRHPNYNTSQRALSTMKHNQISTKELRVTGQTGC